MPLKAPPALDQMSVPNEPSDRSEMCGEVAVASVLQALGHKVTPEDVIGWLRATYGEAWVQHGTGGESPDHLVAALAHWGMPAHVVSGEMISQYLVGAIGRDHYVLCAIYSDAGGNPDPGHHTGHWIVGYGPGQYMNPYGGRYVTYADLSSEDQLYGIEVDASVGMEDDVTPSQLMNLKRSMIWPIRLRHEAWPPSQVAVDSYAGLITDDLSNYEAVITALEQTFEQNHQPSEAELLAGFQQRLAAIAKAAGGQ